MNGGPSASACGSAGSRAIPLLIASNPAFFAVADIESRSYNWYLVAAGIWSVTIFFYSMPCSSRCRSRSLPTLRASPTCSMSARCSSTKCSSVGGIFYNNMHSLECSRGAPNLLILTAQHLLASYTHPHPSIHVTSITVTHTRVCNTVSDTVPALT